MAISPRIFHDIEEASRFAASLLLSALEEKPDLFVCAATGNSPTRTYELFTSSVLDEALELDRLKLLKLDEWGGLVSDDPATCEVYLQRHLVKPLGLRERQFLGFRSDAKDLYSECSRIREYLRCSEPIDICVLGLGVNGHIGFNEPGDELSAGCHLATLSDSSLSHSMLEASLSKPTFGMTLGMSDILAAREILLLVFGPEKAEQLKRVLEGGVTTRCPASLLQLHSQITCVCDRAAASLLSGKN